jgi:hypothetical protein
MSKTPVVAIWLPYNGGKASATPHGPGLQGNRVAALIRIMREKARRRSKIARNIISWCKACELHRMAGQIGRKAGKLVQKAPSLG